jgi:CheY-like chemotaxis protein
VTETRGKRRIVIADDARFWREKICMILEPSGHEVIAVEDGAPAIALCEDPVRTVDLLIVDLVMPGVDGFEVARRLRSQPLTENLPIVAVTSVFKPEDFVEGTDAGGFDAILDKAASPDEFLFIFNKHLYAHLPTSRLAPRVPTQIPAMYDARSRGSGEGVITNLSESGAFLSCRSPVPAGSKLAVDFTLPKGTYIQTESQAIWVNHGEIEARTNYSRGMGIRFRHLSGESVRAVAAFVKSVLEARLISVFYPKQEKETPRE